MLVVPAVGETALIILMSLIVIILFYLTRIAKRAVQRKISSYAPLTQLELTEEHRTQLTKLRKQSENEEVRILADVILSLFTGSYQVSTPRIATSDIQKEGERKKPPVVEKKKGLSKAQLAYTRAMQEEDPLKKKALLQKVVSKYFDSEWADRALEEIVKIKES